MEEEYTLGKMEGATKESTSLIKSMAMDNMCGLMEEGMKAFGNRENNMAKEGMFNKTE